VGMLRFEGAKREGVVVPDPAGLSTSTPSPPSSVVAEVPASFFFPLLPSANRSSIDPLRLLFFTLFEPEPSPFSLSFSSSVGDEGEPRFVRFGPRLLKREAEAEGGGGERTEDSD
jgi:hypothetical protein